MYKISIFLFSLLTLISCSKSVLVDKPGQPVSAGKISHENTQALQQGAIDLFRQSNKQAGSNSNVIISPLSIQYAIGMADNGARGKTLAQLMSVNGQTGADLEGLNEQLAYLYNQLIRTKAGLKMSIANGVFYDGNKFTIKDSYFESLDKFFAAEKSKLDFNDKEKSLSVINGWVSNKTNGRIEKVLNDITPDEFLFLINAIYMKADWDKPFPAELTRDMDFTAADGTVHRTPFISNRLTTGYTRSDEAATIAMSMGNGTLEALFIRPEKREINDFIATVFDQQFIDRQAENARQSDIMLYIPKFKIKQHFDLRAILQRMGISEPFTDHADLSGIGGNPGEVYLTRALHDVFMQLDEKGIEGAAVTTIGVGTTSAPPTVSFDTPFLLVIYDKETKTNIFIGKVANPALEN